MNSIKRMLFIQKRPKQPPVDEVKDISSVATKENAASLTESTCMA
jgi:hypothetical protein